MHTVKVSRHGLELRAMEMKGGWLSCAVGRESVGMELSGDEWTTNRKRPESDERGRTSEVKERVHQGRTVPQHSSPLEIGIPP